MSEIGGNIRFKIQKLTTTQNDFGEDIKSWTDVHTGIGFLDMMSGDVNRTFIAKIEQSTHVFLCDYFKLSEVKAENHRMIVNSDLYEITYIDDPMGLHEHLEIFLKCLGGV